MNFNEFALKVLTWFKKLRGSAVKIIDIERAYAPSIVHLDWNELLKKHVTSTGKVDYVGFKTDFDSLDYCLLQFSSSAPADNWSEKEKRAYWINVYNIYTVKLILDNYPLKSVKDISKGLPMVNSPWDLKFFKINDVEFDLNTIEHDILRTEFDEPRIHFAINCASKSCPKLRNEAYTAVSLDLQLEDQASAFINNPVKNVINEKHTKISKIFDWFQSDFMSETNVLGYIKKYNSNLDVSNKIEYIEYDWTLNE